MFVTHHHHCRLDLGLQTLRVMVEVLQEQLLLALLQQLRLLQQLLMEEVHSVLCQICCVSCCLQGNIHCEVRSIHSSSIAPASAPMLQLERTLCKTYYSIVHLCVFVLCSIRQQHITELHDS